MEQKTSKLDISSIEALLASRSAKQAANVAGDAAGPDDATETQAVAAGPNKRRYVPRKLGSSTMTDVKYLTGMVERGKHVLMPGDPGIGKTALYMECCPEGLQVVTDSDTEVLDLMGGPVADPASEHGFKMELGPVARAAQAGLPILIDEIALCRPSVISCIYPLMDGRGFVDVPGLGRIESKPGFVVVGAYNPKVPGAIMSEALESRFHRHLHLTLTDSLIHSVCPDEDFCDFWRRCFESNVWIPSMRDALEFADGLDSMPLRFAVGELASSCPPQLRKTVAAIADRVWGPGLFVEVGL